MGSPYDAVAQETPGLKALKAGPVSGTPIGSKFAAAVVQTVKANERRSTLAVIRQTVTGLTKKVRGTGAPRAASAAKGQTGAPAPSTLCPVRPYLEPVCPHGRLQAHLQASWGRGGAVSAAARPAGRS